MEVNQIQKKINYNFMSESFINEVIKYLTTNKLEKISQKLRTDYV